jgi:hypothetical protein
VSAILLCFAYQLCLFLLSKSYFDCLLAVAVSMKMCFSSQAKRVLPIAHFELDFLGLFGSGFELSLVEGDL